jgi:hypothetical protein
LSGPSIAIGSPNPFLCRRRHQTRPSLREIPVGNRLT